jgi:hypothetical protein
MAVVRLTRSYTCIQAAPVLHSVDTAIFSLTYFARCMACNFCDDQCCTYGVDIDLGNAMRLAALGDDFSARIVAPRAEWFGNEVLEDAEFPTGRYLRTRAVGGKCVFRNPSGRGCAIHAYAIDKGIDYHELKPLVSTLFPTTFEHGVLVASSEVHDRSLACAGQGPSVYQGARDELKYYFGDAFIAELDALSHAAVEEDTHGPDRMNRQLTG